MKNVFLSLLILVGFSTSTFAQKKKVEKRFDRDEAEAHLTYLASDELMGRDPARPEMQLAIDYISGELEKYGVMQVPGADGYAQIIPFNLSSPPKSGNLKMGPETYSQKESMLVLDGKSLSGSFELVDLGYGLEEDYEGKEVKGKVVVTNLGAPDQMSPAALMALGRKKTALAAENGAIALIEMYNIPSIPWPLIANYLSSDQLSLDQGSKSDLPYLWVKDLKSEMKNSVAKGDVKKADLDIQGKIQKPIEGQNILGWIEGTDKNLKDEFIMLSAHYDHVGVGNPDAEGDTIYNGARDNAVGTVSVLNAAKYFAKRPPKRSVLFALWTAEEKGLLGSAYFAENPLIPLDKIIYNLNIDGAGYNDTSIITVIGLTRTSEQEKLAEAAKAFGLEAIEDQAPEQGLFDRSDNVSFAKKGIPAPTFSLGFTAFDDEISKYYHKAADEVDSMDMDYVVKYWKAYILAAESIANTQIQPFWLSGDKYEEVGKELYGLE
ncbi:M28 family peptidase [Algoriphagus sediminis]|uniref:M20/M25/M40 family metallo-hydrolase n=1 Tax=Algoriphagus sediminis TaxID=3057113 RepID=A0ABT7YBV5_9BACT|nr:M28 family peptidase [Algoriphagus sediminis]MDN3203669.1 M20/M25/M40 family metallo-hydrolase [Algoriphagus sediminis]